jgi:hypothetical protein
MGRGRVMPLSKIKTNSIADDAVTKLTKEIPQPPQLTPTIQIGSSWNIAAEPVLIHGNHLAVALHMTRALETLAD